MADVDLSETLVIDRLSLLCEVIRIKAKTSRENDKFITLNDRTLSI